MLKDYNLENCSGTMKPIDPGLELKPDLTEKIPRTN